MSITLNTTMSSIMTNKRRVGALKSLGVVTVGDALTYYPFRVADPVPLRALREARIGERMAFSASVRGMRVVPMNVRRGYRLEAVVDDGDFAVSRHVAGAAARLVFFSYKKQYVDWLSMRLRSGAIVVIAGEPSEFNGQLQFTHPEIMTVAPGSGPADGEYSGVVQMSALKYDADTVEAGLRRISRPRPVYHASSRISSEHIHESIVQCIELLAGTGQDLPGDAATEAPQTMKPMEDGGTSGAGTAPADAESRSGNAVAVGLARAIPDVLPESVRESNHLLHRAEAFLAIHDPLSTADFKRAIGTMRYEEAFVSQTALLQSRSNVRKDAALPCAGVALRDRFIESLPFPLTGGQREVIDDIGVDMAREYPMQRLLQGEVGSGKTVVAVAAMMQAVGSGKQAVLVAPTQVLAEQHYSSIRGMVDRMCGTGEEADENTKSGESQTKSTHHAVVDESGQVTSGNAPEPQNGGQSDGGQVEKLLDGQSNSLPDIPVLLLTGGMKAAARRTTLAAIRGDEADLIVGTHAILSEGVEFARLGLAVIDEQHRFGVRQRGMLAEKAVNPHLLVMSATPIPRTLGLLLYGDLDISILDELPPGRTPVKTRCITGKKRRDLYHFLDQEIDKGRQVYLVCPAIEDTPDGGLNAVKTYYEDIAKALLPDRRVGLMHGKLKPKEKASVMEDFKAGRLDALVSTTVIEVGVDVPNASVMVIENAERYGLSALHQLRGRVGRGAAESWCFLVSDNTGEAVQKRLKFLCSTTDGFAVAQYDLETRGPGDFFGSRQHGLPTLQIADLMNDTRTLHAAQSEALAMLAEDPLLQAPEHALLAAQVQQMFDKAGPMN